MEIPMQDNSTEKLNHFLPTSLFDQKVNLVVFPPTFNKFTNRSLKMYKFNVKKIKKVLSSEGEKAFPLICYLNGNKALGLSPIYSPCIWKEKKTVSGPKF